MQYYYKKEKYFPIRKLNNLHVLGTGSLMGVSTVLKINYYSNRIIEEKEEPMHVMLLLCSLSLCLLLNV